MNEVHQRDDKKPRRRMTSRHLLCFLILSVSITTSEAGAQNISAPEPQTGTIIGTVIGALIIAVIQYGLVFVNVEPFWQFVAVGVVIIISVLLAVELLIVSRTGSTRSQS